jgi:hypothetical protein
MCHWKSKGTSFLLAQLLSRSVPQYTVTEILRNYELTQKTDPTRRQLIEERASFPTKKLNGLETIRNMVTNPDRAQNQE